MRPSCPSVWESPLEIPVFNVPKDASVLAAERWEHAPVTVALHRGMGAVLWIATSPGKEGYERFPYLLQALHDLGMSRPSRANAYGRSSMAPIARVSTRLFRRPLAQSRHRRDPRGRLALLRAERRVRRISPAADRSLPPESHPGYVWLELPHVSEKFWDAHPEWREKTAILQDAQLDWRKLMNLNNPDCFAAVRRA